MEVNRVLLSNLLLIAGLDSNQVEGIFITLEDLEIVESSAPEPEAANGA